MNKKNRYFFGLLAFIFSITQLTQCAKEDNKPLKKSKESFIISFELGTYKGKLNGTSLLIEVPYAADISSLLAKVKLSEKATIKPDPTKVKDWSNPVSFTVTAENGKDSKKYTVEVKILPAVLTFEKLTKKYTKGGRLNATEILKHVKGEKASYTLKEITSLNPNDIVKVNGTAPNLRLEFNRVGVFTALLRLKHNATSDLDVTISNAEFEITKGDAPLDLNWIKQSKVYRLGQEISNAEILAGISGTKTGYTIKTVTISDAGGTGASVSGMGTSAKIGSYTRVGNLTLTLVLEHATKADKTIRGAVFEITEGLTWRKQSKVYGSGGEISNVELLGGLWGPKEGYRIKSVAITSDSSGSGARVSVSGSGAKIVGYSKATILTLTLVLEHATKADKTIRGAAFEITKKVAPINLTWVKQLKTYRSGDEISNVELLSGIEGSKVGYRIKTVEITNDSSISGARVSGMGTAAKIVGYSKATIFTLTLVLEHDTKADKTLSNAVFEIRKMPVPVDLSWRKQSKSYSSGGEISNAELLSGLIGTKTGYRMKTLTISSAGGTGARVSGMGTSAKIVGYTKVGVLTLSIVFEHDTKEDKHITSGEFEITKGSAPSDLTWRKQSKAYSSGGHISNADLLAGLTGTDKTGYTIKLVIITDTNGTGARVSGSGTSAKIDNYTKLGILTLSIVFEHATKEDKNITGGEFEITKASAPRLTWTKQQKAFSSGGEITNTNLLAGVTGSGKTGYTIKTVTITNYGGITNARVSGSGRAAKITSYTKAGTLTLTLVLAHETKDDATIRNAQFEITKISAPTLTWTKQQKVYTNGREITNADLLAGVTGSGKTGYTIKTVTISNDGGMTSARVSVNGTSAKITSYRKAGTLTLTLVLEHSYKADVTISNAQFEITKGSAGILSWTKQKKIYTNGREITNANLLAGVTTGSGKTSYTIKSVTISDAGGTGARVSGSGRAAKITSYHKVGTLTLTLVLEHDTKKDVTLTGAQFEIYKIFDITSSGVVTLKTGVDKNSLTTVIIPNTIDGTTVTIIGNETFYNCRSLTSVTIRNSVTSIGSSAFYGCSSLTSITIPNSVTSIGSSVFSNCSKLTSITIPNSVTSIGSSVFSNCSKLTSITIGNSVTSIGSWAFSHCTSLTRITIPNSVTSIGTLAFSHCTSLTRITIGNSVASIGRLAFSYCTSLTSITIPNSVTSIGGEPFKDCSKLTTIEIPNAKVSDWEANLRKGNTASVVGY